jgi:hypothetical protein
MPIRFYRLRDELGCLSNFSSHGFELGGRWWPTVEHCFQAMKHAGTPHEERVRAAATPAQAKRLGRTSKVTLRPDWDSVRDEVMRAAVLAKFRAHADIRATLLATGDEVLIENAPTDHYWGCGRDGTGRNRLGEILMEVRALLRAEDAE